MKRLFISMCLSITGIANAQTLTIEECHQKALEHSTLNSQYKLQTDISDSKRKALNATYLPQAEINTRLSYQSDVIALPFTVPGIEIPTLSKDQYQATIDLRQMIYDGGYVSSQKKVLEQSLDTEKHRLDIIQSEVKDKTSNLYIAVLLLDENIKIIELALSNINNNITQIDNRVKEGVVLKTHLDMLEAERMKLQQKITETKCNRTQTIELLSSIIGDNISTDTQFIVPTTLISPSDKSCRAEYQLFDAQRGVLKAQQKVVNSKNLPKIQAFATGGYGRPGLNMMSNDFASYFVVGAKLSIPLTNWTATRHERRTIQYQQNLIDEQQREFVRQNESELKTQLLEISKFETLIEQDKVIVKKCIEITASQEERLLNGVITSNEYITDLNAEQQARLNQLIHELQLTGAIIKYNSLLGDN